MKAKYNAIKSVRLPLNASDWSDYKLITSDRVGVELLRRMIRKQARKLRAAKAVESRMK